MKNSTNKKNYIQLFFFFVWMNELINNNYNSSLITLHFYNFFSYFATLAKSERENYL